ncbi:NAD(P)/FAD-dependent oxidoreductase [Niveispirillum sp. KHB5.9]|uniref:NAD(P)/FAD-dependent oxidoreductase n=1 Tax=Niveispirillum sp. KHB5.9 TaxID=3400269 RepID=UPI003A8BDD1B
MEDHDATDRDCLVIGGGPAGLTAAIYLARYHLSVTVIDSGQSRAALIPLTRNHAGFPEGISGAELLFRMWRQADRYGAEHRTGTVTELTRTAEGFMAWAGPGRIRARAVLLATGVVNRRPEGMDNEDHGAALADGLVRYCPVCDAYEVTDRRIAVLGTGERGCAEALFLRSYSVDVTLVAPGGGHTLTDGQRGRLTEAGIAIAGTCGRIRPRGQTIDLDIDDVATSFDTLYPALGSHIRSELAGSLGTALSEDGCLVVDAHQRTSIPGLYAAGDVVLGLDQISQAMGGGAVAATTIRNDLARRMPLLRRAGRGLPASTLPDGG